MDLPASAVSSTFHWLSHILGLSKNFMLSDESNRGLLCMLLEGMPLIG